LRGEERSIIVGNREYIYFFVELCAVVIHSVVYYHRTTITTQVLEVGLNYYVRNNTN
jgi:hypothetical protein